MKKLSLSDKVILRKEEHLDAFFVFNIDTLEIWYLDKESFSVLELVEKTGEICANKLAEQLCISADEVTELIHECEEKHILVDKPAITSPTTEFWTTPGDFNVPVVSAPYQVDIFLTNRCNLKCLHCYVDAGAKLENELTLNQWKHIFDQLERARVMKVIIGGGEPYCHPEIDDIIEYLGQKRFVKGILSNGVLITEQRVLRLREGNISISISLDGKDPQTHDFFRSKKGAFQKVINSLALCQKYGVNVTILVTLFEKNIDQIDDIINIARNYGVDSIGFSPIDTLGRGTDPGNARLFDFMSRINDVEKYIIGLGQTYHDINIIYIGWSPKHIDIEDSSTPKDVIYCRAGTTWMNISADGKVYPCNLVINKPQHVIGNATDQDLSSIWQSNLWERWRGKYKIKDIDKCNCCTRSENCNLRNCRVKAEMLTGDFLGFPSQEC